MDDEDDSMSFVHCTHHYLNVSRCYKRIPPCVYMGTTITVVVVVAGCILFVIIIRPVIRLIVIIKFIVTIFAIAVFFILRHFAADLVLQVGGPLVAGTSITVGRDIATMQRQTPERNPADDGNVVEKLEEEEDVGLKTAGLYVSMIPGEISWPCCLICLYVAVGQRIRIQLLNKYSIYDT